MGIRWAFRSVRSVSDIPGGSTVGGLTVDLTVSGGYNGNLYAYLVAPNGTLVTLLNQPGVTGGNPFGYGGSGLNVTLSDTAAGSIQTTAETAGAVFSGTYQAAGTLGNINGSAADGTWTLFFADEAAGGGQADVDRLESGNHRRARAGQCGAGLLWRAAAGRWRLALDAAGQAGFLSDDKF